MPLRRRRRLLAFSLFLAALACEPRTRKVLIKTDLPPGTKVDVSIYGAPLTTLEAPDLVFDAPTWAPDQGHQSCALPPCRGEDSNSLVFRFQTPCGTKAYCASFPQDTSHAPMPPRGEPLVGHLHGRYTTPTSSCARAFYVLHVDNRGQPPHVLTVGSSFVRTISAGAAESLDIPIPSCDAESRMALDGRTLGMLPTKADHQAYLLDPSGARCYTFTSFLYAPSGSPSPGSGRPRLLRGNRAYQLEDAADDFLTPAPRSIQSLGGVGSRTELVEVACEPTARTHPP